MRGNPPERGARVVTRGAARFVVTEWRGGDRVKITSLDDDRLERTISNRRFSDVETAVAECVRWSSKVARLARREAA